MSKPRLLDLFAGAGGSARGYQQAGFYVVGVDNVFQPRYAGDEFRQLDALEALGNVGLPGWEFDAVHCSPPCQGYTTMNHRHGSSKPLLIDSTRLLLRATGVPWVIENVPGALAHMRSPIELTGEMFGLGVHRPRLFESNVMLLAPPRPSRQTNPVAVYGKQDGRRLWTRVDGTELRVADLETASEAMSIDWMTWDEIREAIPPVYCEFIGTQLMNVLECAA